MGTSAQATGLADAFLARHLGRLPLGLTVPDDRFEIVRSATQTLLDDQEARDLGDLYDVSTGERLSRMADGMVGTAGRQAYQEGLQGHGVERWTRQTSSDNPCPLCTDLADGTVLSVDQEMIDHPGCSCVAEPVIGSADA